MNLFHPNRLETDQFSFELEKGVRVRCQITEEWESVLDRTVKCGAKYQHKLRLKRGFSSSELQSFEESIKASLGVKGLGSFQGTIKNQTQKSITFAEETEEEHQLEFQAPACGFYHISLFQKIRHFNFEFSRPKFFGGETKWGTSLSKRLPNYHDESTIEPNDPSCSCPPPEKDLDGEVQRGTVIVLHKDFSLKTNFREMQNSLGVPGLRVYLPDLHISLKGPLDRLYWPQFTLWTNRFPKHLIQLANITSETIEFQIAPALSDSLIELESKFGLNHERLRELYPIYFESIEHPRPVDAEVVSAEPDFSKELMAGDRQIPLTGEAY
jgi:hypothetical protein